MHASPPGPDAGPTSPQHGAAGPRPDVVTASQFSATGHPGPYAHGAPSPYPPGYPPRRRRSGSRALITVLGVLGALFLLVGGTVLAGQALVSTLNFSASSTQDRAAAPNTAERVEALRGDWRDSVYGAHSGVVVDWDAPEYSGVAVDPGDVVEQAPGIVLVTAALPTQQSDGIVRESFGTGTGIILNEDGLAITNYHVVEGSTTVSVEIADTGRRYTATVLGRDAEHDVAVLHLDNAQGLATASVATSTPRPGDAIAGVGNGGGQGFLTAVRGEVLGLDRSIYAGDENSTELSRLTGLIQTDADIVSGYSGGPMVDGNGQVVAVSVAASDGTTSAEVDGFGIPIEVALDVVDQVLAEDESGTVRVSAKGALGITIVAQDGVVVVAAVDDGSAAERLGLVAGDTITMVDNTRVGASPDRLSGLVGRRSTGDEISVQWVTAEGQQRQGRVTLQDSRVN
ncbi:MAG: trypsin-like peptidase domain-containing protein [Micrococcus sp.]|nr:trypsin-like peptidase domain-containing protein [Micrococcus sp.]